ncbi:hypothetical protein TrRE_jg11857, partial [Triparma retinervis]
MYNWLSQQASSLGVDTSGIDNLVNSIGESIAPVAGPNQKALQLLSHKNESGYFSLLQTGSIHITSVLQDSKQTQSIHIAASHNCQEVLKHCIDQGVDRDLKDSRGDTPLHHAARGGQLEATKYLVKAQADVAARNQE